MAFDPDKFAKSVGATSHKPDKKEIEQRLKALRQKVQPYIKQDASGTITTKELRDFEKLLKQPFDRFYQQSDDPKVFNHHHAIAQQMSRLYAKMDDSQRKKYRSLMKKSGFVSESLSLAEKFDSSTAWMKKEILALFKSSLKDRKALRSIEKELDKSKNASDMVDKAFSVTFDYPELKSSGIHSKIETIFDDAMDMKVNEESIDEAAGIDIKKIKDKVALKKIEKIDKSGDKAFYHPSTKDVKSLKDLKKEYGNRKKINTDSGYSVVLMDLTPASRGNFSLGY